MRAGGVLGDRRDGINALMKEAPGVSHPFPASQTVRNERLLFTSYLVHGISVTAAQMD